jgi:hypothetical protein
MIGKLKGKRALVTGASSGIGAELADNLASLGADLVLVARRKEVLEEIAIRIRGKYGVEVLVEPADLGRPGEAERLHESLERRGQRISILVNNAGFGAYGPFDSIDPATEESMIDLDIKAVTRLTRLFIGSMRADGYGRILLTASTGAYQPTPFYASYSASKAFVLSYGHAIRRELRCSGVSVTVLSPGVTRTDFHRLAGHETNSFKRATMMEVAPVARVAVRALLRGKAEVVPGLLNKLLAFSSRLAPRTLQASIAAALMR